MSGTLRRGNMCFSSFFFSPYISINCIRGSCRSVAAPACSTAPLPRPTPLGEHVLGRRPPWWLWFCPPCLRPHGPLSRSPPRGDFRSIPAGLPALPCSPSGVFCRTPAFPGSAPPARSAGRGLPRRSCQHLLPASPASLEVTAARPHPSLWVLLLPDTFPLRARTRLRSELVQT